MLRHINADDVCLQSLTVHSKAHATGYPMFPSTMNRLSVASPGLSRARNLRAFTVFEKSLRALYLAWATAISDSSAMILLLGIYSWIRITTLSV
jgi:hypothetical protein